jgi:protein-L-isoaspartate(D-aspartate) O-methyltransferase
VLSEPDSISKAFAEVPRDHYVLEGRGQLAQTTAPASIEKVIRLLDPQIGDNILEIGTGSGYSTALLAVLVESNGSVVSIDVDGSLIDRARHKLDSVTVADNVELIGTDGSMGWLPRAPYDRVVAWCAVDAVPEAWVEQVRAGGVILTPIRPRGEPAGTATIRYVVGADGTLARDGSVSGGFVPLTRERVTDFDRLRDEMVARAQAERAEARNPDHT